MAKGLGFNVVGTAAASLPSRRRKAWSTCTSCTDLCDQGTAILAIVRRFPMLSSSAPSQIRHLASASAIPFHPPFVVNMATWPLRHPVLPSGGWPVQSQLLMSKTPNPTTTDRNSEPISRCSRAFAIRRIPRAGAKFYHFYAALAHAVPETTGARGKHRERRDPGRVRPAACRALPTFELDEQTRPFPQLPVEADVFGPGRPGPPGQGARATPRKNGSNASMRRANAESRKVQEELNEINQQQILKRVLPRDPFGDVADGLDVL